MAEENTGIKAQIEMNSDSTESQITEYSRTRVSDKHSPE